MQAPRCTRSSSMVDSWIWRAHCWVCLCLLLILTAAPSSARQPHINLHHLLAKKSVSVSIPSCCPDPGVPRDGTRTGGGRLIVGSILRFACNPGFLLRGSEALSCMHGEGNILEWNADLPECVVLHPNIGSPDPCGPPPEPATFAFILSYSVGGSVGYSCLDGYVPISGNEQLTCTGGRWQRERLHCRRIGQCKDEGNFANGRKILGGTRENDTVNFVCNEGHLLLGNRQLHCGSDGNWNGSWPQCAEVSANCGDPGRITNGRRFVSGTTRGSTVRFLCSHGHVLRGSEERTCSSEGEWSASTPSCKGVRCNSPSRPHHGSVSYSTTQYGAKATYTCNPGHVLSGAIEITCAAAGTWSEPPPQCTRVECGMPRNPNHGTIIPRFRGTPQYGDAVSYSCLRGYGLVGSSDRTCQADSSWSGNTPSCMSDSCGTLNNPINGLVTMYGMTLGGAAVYSCDSGYTLSNPERAQRICGLYSVWSGESPTCQAITCNRLTIPLYATLTMTNENRYGSVAEYTCNFGYIMVSGQESLQRHCEATGLWTGLPTDCYEVKCPPLEGPHNGRVVMSGQGLGDEASYSCQETHQLAFGDEIRTCSQTNQWTGLEPCCVQNPVFCKELGSPPTSSVVLTGEQVGDRADYTCNEGLNRVGGDLTRTCLPSGMWSGEEPLCSVTCSLLLAPANGSVTLDGNRPGDRAEYSCNPGFMLIETGEGRECQDNGEWSGTPSTCDPATMGPLNCDKLTAPKNGAVDLSQGMMSGSMAMYSCDEGYVLSGIAERICDLNKNGDWSGTQPTCLPVDCGLLPPPTNGDVQVSSTTLGSALIYQCDVGYVLTTHSIRVCLADGRWSGMNPACQPIDCGLLLPPINGDIKLPLTTLGSVPIYQCDVGFVLTSPFIRVCLANGSWSGMSPVCQPLPDTVMCPTLSDPSNGAILMTNTTVGSVVSYTCSRGYRLDGPMTRECQSGGNWTGSDPVCSFIDCGVLEDPANGRVTTLQGTTLNRIARYFCDRGFVTVGSNFRLCGSTSMWGGMAPTCRAIDCGQLMPPVNGLVDTTGGTVFEREAVYSCREGYEVNGPTTRQCLASGQWNGMEPTCSLVDCGNLDPPQRGRVFLSGTTFGSQANYSCDTHHKLVGPDSRECLEEGLWSNTQPTCEALQCPELANPSGGVVDTPTRTVGSLARYSCSLGYTLMGSDVSECLESEMWSNEPPTCQMIVCTDLSAPEDGMVEVRGRTVGGEAVYRCNPGFVLRGSTTRICVEDGQWTGEQPVCEAVTCPVLPGLTNGLVVVSTRTAGSRAVYVCNSGYAVLGVIARLCGDDGRWTEEEPVCIRDNCDEMELTNPMNGMVTYTNNAIGSIATYSCITGYRLVGDSTRECAVVSSSQNSWSGAPPRCIKIVCPTLMSPINGGVFVTHSCFGGAALYTCNAGFIQSNGLLKRTCRENSQWDGEEPSCEPLPDTVMCSTLSDPSNGAILMTTTTVGSVVSYTCSRRYQLDGPMMRECQSGGQWTGSDPVCSFIDCGVLEGPANGRVTTLQGTTLNRIARYFCDGGFVLVGSDVRLCGSTSMWGGMAPTCRVIDCGQLMPPVNGLVDTTGGTVFEREAVYSCREGYEVNGPTTRQCLASGQWNGMEPTCSLIGTVPDSCGDPGTPVNGGRVLRATIVGSMVEYSCNNGYMLSAGGNRVCLSNQQWSGVLPSCNPVMCPVLANPDNGRVLGDGVTVGSRVTYFCNTGYNIRRTDVIFRECLQSGEWSGEEPMCIPLQCMSLPAIADGNVAIASLRVGSMAEYSCNPGFVLTGPQMRTCQPGGVWSGREPACTSVECGDPGRPVNGRAVMSDFSVGSRVYFVCDDGFQTQDSIVLQCMTNGSWSAPMPTCTPARANAAATNGCSGESELYSTGSVCQCVDGKLTSCCRYRQDWTTLSQTEKQRYISTVKTVSTSPEFQPLYNELIKRYEDSFNTIAQYVMSDTSQFFPWHRYFLLEYENLLRMVEPSITIPYWDWSMKPSRPYESSVFDPESGFGNSADNVTMCLKSGPFQEGQFVVTPSAEGTCLKREYAVFQYPSRSHIEEEFLSLRADHFDQFHNSIQLFVSLNTRCYVGGHMCTPEAANDPLYLLQMSRIDLILERWQRMDNYRATVRYHDEKDPLVLTFDDSLAVSDFSNNSALPYSVCVKYAPLQPVEEVNSRTTLPSSGPDLPTIGPLKDSRTDAVERRSAGVDCSSLVDTDSLEQNYLRDLCG